MTHRTYHLFGTSLRSPWSLPELGEGAISEPAEIEVLQATIPEWPVERDEQGNGFSRQEDGCCYVQSLMGALRVRNEGRVIEIDPLPDATPESIRLALLGPAMGLIMIQRGHLVLHGSAVAIDGRAVAFLGSRGRGKSTTAASLLARGHRLVTDDVLVIDGARETAQVIPAHPRVKLWPDAVRRLGRDPAELSKVLPTSQKLELSELEAFDGQPLPLGHVFFLAGGPEISIAPISSARAFPLLMSHWFGARFGATGLALLDRRKHLESCARLIQSVPISGLQRPQDLDQLERVTEHIEAVVRGSTP